jgi:hypothetical protein
MRLWPNTNIVKQKIWQPAVRRWSKWGAVLVIGASLVVIIGGGVVLAQLGGAGHQSSSSDIELQRGLVGWWKLNGNAKDSTPYADNGTVFGSTVSPDQENNAGQAYCFNGTASDYVNINDSSALDPTQAMSISVWFMANGTGTLNGSIVYNKENQYELSAGGGYVTYAWEPNWAWMGGTTFPITVGTWYLATVVYNGSYQYLYDNGQLVYSVSLTGSIATNTNRLAFATRGTSGGGQSPFGGCMNNVRIYNRALSSAEVNALYNEYSPSLNTNSGENGLIGWWKMQGNAEDSTPYSNNGTVNGATLTTDREGAANSAYSFNGGSGNNITVASTFGLGTANLTISCWVYVPSTSDHGAFVKIGNNQSASNNGYAIGIGSGTYDTNGDTFLLLYEGVRWISTSTAIPVGWHLFTMTVNGSGVPSAYMDGSLLGSYSGTSPSAPTSSQTDIGGYTSSSPSNRYFNGLISDVRVYNRALSATEVSNLYNSYNAQVELGGSGTSGSVSLGKGLVGYWPLTGNAKDATPYADNGTVNGTTLTTDREGRANSAYSFNGSSNYIDIPISLSPTAMTVSLWFNATSLTSGNSRLIANSHTDADDHGFQLEFNSGGGSGFFDVGNGSAEGRATWSGSLSTGTWYNYVGIYTGSAVYAYINRVQVAYTAFSGGAIASSSYDVNIGRNPAYAGDYFDGTISDVRVYNRALNVSEVVALYNQYD